MTVVWFLFLEEVVVFLEKKDPKVNWLGRFLDDFAGSDLVEDLAFLDWLVVDDSDGLRFVEVVVVFDVVVLEEDLSLVVVAWRVEAAAAGGCDSKGMVEGEALVAWVDASIPSVSFP